MKTKITEIFSEQYFKRNPKDFLQSEWIETIIIFWSNEIESNRTEFTLTPNFKINPLEQNKFKDLCNALHLTQNKVKKRIYFSTKISIQ